HLVRVLGLNPRGQEPTKRRPNVFCPYSLGHARVVEQVTRMVGPAECGGPTWSPKIGKKQKRKPTGLDPFLVMSRLDLAHERPAPRLNGVRRRLRVSRYLFEQVCVGPHHRGE